MNGDGEETMGAMIRRLVKEGKTREEAIALALGRTKQTARPNTPPTPGPVQPLAVAGKGGRASH